MGGWCSQYISLVCSGFVEKDGHSCAGLNRPELTLEYFHARKRRLVVKGYEWLSGNASTKVDNVFMVVFLTLKCAFGGKAKPAARSCRRGVRTSHGATGQVVFGTL